MKTNDIKRIANENGLNVVFTTTGKNGYPKSTAAALTGFATYDDAEKFSASHGGSVNILHRKNGWEFFEDKGETSSALLNSEKYEGNADVSVYHAGDEFCEMELAEDIAEDMRNGGASEETISEMMDGYRKADEALNGLTENEILVFNGTDRTFEIETENVTSVYDDCHEYVIAVVFYGE